MDTLNIIGSHGGFKVQTKRNGSIIEEKTGLNRSEAESHQEVFLDLHKDDDDWQLNRWSEKHQRPQV